MESREQRLARLEAAGIVVASCPGCAEFYAHPKADPFTPRHNASSRCKSGKKNHCTCEACF